MASTVGGLSIVKVEEEKPWYAAYPAPRATASVITRETILSWISNGKVVGRDLVLVDLRRMDYEVRL